MLINALGAHWNIYEYVIKSPTGSIMSSLYSHDTLIEAKIPTNHKVSFEN